MAFIDVTICKQQFRILVIFVSFMATVFSSGFGVIGVEKDFANRSTTEFMVGSPFASGTVGRCYLHCIADRGCMSFFYNRITQMCQLHSIVFLSVGKSNLATVGGSDYYRMNNDQCRRNYGYMLNRNLGVCFTLIEIVPPFNMSYVRQLCSEANGGQLISIQSEEKQALVRETSKRLKPGLNVITGLSRSSDQEPWKWEGNNNLTWSAWVNGTRFDVPSANCVYMRQADNWLWNVHACTGEQGKLAACEIVENAPSVY